MTNRAIYATVAEDEGWVKVKILGDLCTLPQSVHAATTREALGYRKRQYDALIEVDEGTLDAEVERRTKLAAEMVWKGE